MSAEEYSHLKSLQRKSFHAETKLTGWRTWGRWAKYPGGPEEKNICAALLGMMLGYMDRVWEILLCFSFSKVWLTFSDLSDCLTVSYPTWLLYSDVSCSQITAINMVKAKFLPWSQYWQIKSVESFYLKLVILCRCRQISPVLVVFLQHNQNPRKNSNLVFSMANRRQYQCNLLLDFY